MMKGLLFSSRGIGRKEIKLAETGPWCRYGAATGSPTRLSALVDQLEVRLTRFSSLCGQGDRRSYYDLELDRGQSPERAVASFAVVFPLDPRHDRETQLSTRARCFSAADVLLEEAEEPLCSGVITTGPNAAHSPVELVAISMLFNASAPKLTASVAMDDDVPRKMAGEESVPKRTNRQ